MNEIVTGNRRYCCSFLPPPGEGCDWRGLLDWLLGSGETCGLSLHPCFNLRIAFLSVPSLRFITAGHKEGLRCHTEQLPPEWKPPWQTSLKHWRAILGRVLGCGEICRVWLHPVSACLWKCPQVLHRSRPDHFTSATGLQSSMMKEEWERGKSRVCRQEKGIVLVASNLQRETSRQVSGCKDGRTGALLHNLYRQAISKIWPNFIEPNVAKRIAMKRWVCSAPL